MTEAEDIQFWAAIRNRIAELYEELCKLKWPVTQPTPSSIKICLRSAHWITIAPSGVQKYPYLIENANRAALGTRIEVDTHGGGRMDVYASQNLPQLIAVSITRSERQMYASWYHARSNSHSSSGEEVK